MQQIRSEDLVHLFKETSSKRHPKPDECFYRMTRQSDNVSAGQGVQTASSAYSELALFSLKIWTGVVHCKLSRPVDDLERRVHHVN